MFRNPIPACCALLVSFATLAGAHEYWLAPSTFVPLPGEAIELRALTGDGFAGERRPCAPERIVRLVARAGRELDLRPVVARGDSVWARFVPVEQQGVLFAYESDFTTLTLEGKAFEDYLTEEGLDVPLATRRAQGENGPGRERYRRCAKVWLSGNDRARATRPVGLPGEILPLTGPGLAPALRVRVLFEGRPLAGVLLRAWRQPLAPGNTVLDPVARPRVSMTWSGRSDASGEVEVPVAEAGEWLISGVHMVPSRDPAAADWESTWMSLVFARLEKAGMDQISKRNGSD